MSASSATGLLCVVSGPSGSGKTTLCRALETSGEVYYTVSATTRLPRPGEIDGADYHFFSEEKFHAMVAAGEFLEWASVYGRCYGTLRSEVCPRLARGEAVVMDLDVQGAATLRRLEDPLIRAAHFDVFVLPASLEELTARLRGRDSEDPASLERRLAAALEEIARRPAYAYSLVSTTREADLQALRCIIAAERMRTSRLPRLDGFR